MRKQKRTEIIMAIVVICLGGFGLFTALRLKRKLLEIYRSLSEAMVRILVIDTASSSSYLESDKFEIGSEDLKLIQPECQTISFNPGYDFDWDRHQALKALVPPDVRGVITDPNATAGGGQQLRALSRAAFEWSYSGPQGVKQRILDLFTNTFTQETIEKFEGLAREFKVFVVASTAGATGSSISIPVGYTIHRLKMEQLITFPLRPMGMFALPEIFSSTSPRIYANSYEFLKELNFFMREDTAWEIPGSAEPPVKARPFDLVYAFSKSNGYLELKNQEELAELISDYIVLSAQA